MPVAPVCTPSMLGQVYCLATLGLLAQYSYQVLIQSVGFEMLFNCRFTFHFPDYY